MMYFQNEDRADEVDRAESKEKSKEYLMTLLLLTVSLSS